MLIDQLKPFFDWLHIHPHWGGFFVFLISFGESIALFGLLVPGSVVMTAIGALMGAGILPIYPMLSWAIVGAVLGDIFSFCLGAYFHQNIRNIWPFNRYPGVLIKGEAFFARHGGKSVFLGRFVGPIRPVIPLIAGMLNMKPSRFFIADIPAAIAWAPAYMLPGILLGELSLRLSPALATRFLLVIFASLMVLWLIYWLVKRLVLAVVGILRHFLTYIWLRFSPEVRWMKFMHSVGNPQDARQFNLLMVFFLLFIVLSVLIYGVIHQGILVGWDTAIYHFMRSLQNPTVDFVMNAITFLGVGKLLFLMSAVVSLYLGAKRRFWALLHWVSLNGLSYVLIIGLKNWVQATRPGSLFLTQYGWSFPSGHTTLTTAVLGFLAVLLTENTTIFVKRLSYVVVTVVVALVGISRLYLGFHWLSDVAGGMLCGCLLISGMTFSYRRLAHTSLDFKPLCFIAILTYLSAWGGYTWHYFHHLPQTSTPYWPVQIVDEKSWWGQQPTHEPLYRTNRFGKPVQLINVQWAGDLKCIQRALERQGWQTPAKPDLSLIVSYFADKTKSHLNPVLFTKYYLDRKPVLVMIKTIDGKNSLVITLNLWNSHTILRHNGETIWVGTVSYYRPWTSLMLKAARHYPMASSTPAIEWLKKDLGAFRWKRMIYQGKPRIPDKDWAGYTLLARSKLNEVEVC